jgi:hypothetical protein
MKIVPHGLCAVLLLLSLCVSALASDEIPYNDLSNQLQVPTNAPTARVLMLPPPSPGGAPTPPDSPSTETNFLGIIDNLAAWPPDTHGTVGPNHVMTMLNTQVRIQSRTGATNSTQSLSNWWSSAGTFSSVFDPRVLYDPDSQRWIATAATDAGTTASSLLIAVSATSRLLKNSSRV